MKNWKIGMRLGIGFALVLAWRLQLKAQGQSAEAARHTDTRLVLMLGGSIRAMLGHQQGEIGRMAVAIDALHRAGRRDVLVLRALVEEAAAAPLQERASGLSHVVSVFKLEIRARPSSLAGECR